METGEETGARASRAVCEEEDGTGVAAARARSKRGRRVERCVVFLVGFVCVFVRGWVAWV